MLGVVITGPTGSGKTKISIEVAKRINGEIISCDSMQVYKFMDIGTAKVNKDEMQGIQHHLIDVVKPSEKFNVGLYQNEVIEVLEKIKLKGKVPIVVGGTGLYLKAITEGLAKLPEQNEAIRDELSKLSNDELINELKEIDIETYNTIDRNRKRIIRAIEVYRLTNEPISKLKKNNFLGHSWDFIKFVFNYDRKELYNRINIRVDNMVKNGLLKEAKYLYDSFNKSVTSLQAIGYKELFKYFEDEESFEESIEKIKQNSRRYAKRQLTWFRKMDGLEWIEKDNKSDEEIIEYIVGKFEMKLK